MSCSSCNNSYQYYSRDCKSLDGCPSDICPDFIIRRYDTMPSFKVKVEDCDGPLDLTDLVLEATMWAKAKLKKSILADDEYFGLADNIGFNQVMVGDIIIIDQARLPERMLVTAFDEKNKLIKVQRGYHGTTASDWDKGSLIRIFKFINSPARIEMVYQDLLKIDGTYDYDVLTDSFLIYDWSAQDTCLAGCFYLEFKLLKMTETQNLTMLSDDVIPSFTSPDLIPEDFGCGLSEGVEWVRKFPVEGEGFLVKITNSTSIEE